MSVYVLSELQFMGFIGWAAVRVWLALVVSYERWTRVYEHLRAFMSVSMQSDLQGMQFV